MYFTSIDYMGYIQSKNPYCIKDGIPMILFQRGNQKHFVCGHCGVCSICQVTKKKGFW